MAKVKNGYSEPWSGYAARYARLYFSPGKPSRQDIAIFCRLIKKLLKKAKRVKRALILGATPSLRDVIAKFNCEIYCIDISKAMFEEMTKLIRHKKPEVFVNGNWIKMPFEDNFFDIVIGDLVFENLDAKTKPIFVKEVARVLKPECCWIHRIFFVPSNWKKEATTAVLKKFSKMDAKYDRNTELFINLLYNTYNKHSHEVDAGKIKEELSAYWKKNKCQYPANKRVEKLLNRAFKMWEPFKKKWHTGTKKESFSCIKKCFEITKEEYSNDHLFAKTFPIVTCKVKK